MFLGLYCRYKYTSIQRDGGKVFFVNNLEASICRDSVCDMSRKYLRNKFLMNFLCARQAILTCDYLTLMSLSSQSFSIFFSWKETLPAVGYIHTYIGGREEERREDM